jgi:hypothetical protein
MVEGAVPCVTGNQALLFVVVVAAILVWWLRSVKPERRI